MKQHAILTLALNNISSDFNRSLNSIEKYCKRYKIDLHVLTQPEVHGPHIYLEKFKFVELLNTYEQVCYIDIDVLITPHARNIFETYNDLNCFYAFEENSNLQYMCRDGCVIPLLNDCPDWPLNNLNKYRYFNAGVFLTSHLHKECFKNFKHIPNIPGINTFGDQTYLNYLITKNKIPFQALSHSFNRMHLGLPDPLNERYKADIIHYAGQDNKINTINSDYKNLYEII